MLQYAYTILYVDHVATTVAFYTQAFGFEQKFMDDAGHYAELNTGDTRLAFCSKAFLETLHKTPTAHHAKRPCFELGFATPDVEQAVAKAITAGAELIQPPTPMPWGQIIAYVADLNGFLIELCTPMPD